MIRCRFDSHPKYIFLGPEEWLNQLDRNANGQVLLTLPELVAAGYAQVVAVEPCPPIASGPGRVVLGTFHHSAGDVYDVWLSDGSQLGVTARHPVWSVDRGEWVSVGDLEPGETLETLDGPVQFESATQRSEAAPVFNLEVDADHAYRVGEHGVLVHNDSGAPSPCGPATVCDPPVDTSNDSDKLGNNMAPGKPNADIAKGSVSNYPEAHHIVQAGGSGECQVNNRQMLFDCCIGLNDAINGVWLPKSCVKGSKNLSTNPTGRTYHNMTFRTHKLYCEWVDLQLSATGGDCKKVRAALQKMRKVLISGQAPWLLDKKIDPSKEPC